MRTQHPMIAPAVMADEWDDLTAQIEQVASVAKIIQIDVMDGHLVPSFSFPYNKTMLDGRQLPHADDVFLDVHLMVQHPQEVGERFIHAGARRITAQIEGFREGEVERVCALWKESGAEVGLSLMLDTPLECVEPFVRSGLVTMLQVMSINRVGYQGESFDERARSRIQELRARYPQITIAVDGGVKSDMVQSLTSIGVDVCGIGSAIMKADDPQKAFIELQKLVS